MTTAAGTQILALIDSLLALPRPASADVMRVLGLLMTKTEAPKAFEEYEGSFGSGPFEKVVLSHHLALGSGMVNLWGRAGNSIHERELEMTRYGPPRPGEANPHIPPEGALSYVYKLQNNARELHFSFLYRSRTLRVISVRWLPAAK